MDVIFEVQRGRTFSIEVGFFDTVLEIKEKVQKYQGIPIPKQTLILKGQVLQDDDDVWKVEILQNTRIQLLVSPDPSTSSPSTPDTTTNNKKKHVVEESTNKTVKLNVKMTSSNNNSSSKTHVVVPFEMDRNDTVLRLKEKIHESMEGGVPPVNRLILHANANANANAAELHDHQLLRDYCDNAEIEVSFRAPPPPAPTTVVNNNNNNNASVAGGGGGGGSGGGSMPNNTNSNSSNNNNNKNRLRVMVLPKSGTKKIPVEVNAGENVGELRKELQRLHHRLQSFHLPQDGYFFIYKQNVMDDDKSFRWHHVAHGDTIEIFNGSVTGGS